MESYQLVLTCCASQEEAERIVNKVLKADSLACANIIPGIKSLLVEGKITDASEVVVLMRPGKSISRN